MVGSGALQPMDMIDPDIRQKFGDALGSGDMFALFERTREAIEQFPDDPDARYLQALAMARLGDPHAALRIYERNRVEEIGTEDALALRGPAAQGSCDPGDGARNGSTCSASRAALTGGPTSCPTDISPESMPPRLPCWPATRAKRASWPRRSCSRPDIAEPNDYYAAASGAEAMLVGGEVEEAILRFAAARHRPDASPGNVASTARQVATDCRAARHYR